MSTKQQASVSITNNFGGNAKIVFFMNDSDFGTLRQEWSVPAGQTSDQLTVYFKTGIGTWGERDWWSVMVHVLDGPNAGLFVNEGTVTEPFWKECQLQHHDANTTIMLSVSPTSFDIPLKSGGCSNGMKRLTPPATKPISHVFVMMFENHSFDNMLAMSGIAGITAASTQDFNVYNGQRYNVTKGAPLTMLTDPGHEFEDVVTQLCGEGAKFVKGQPYPKIGNTGFVASYATSTSEAPHKPPPAADVPDIMACFDTPSQLPTMDSLAREFVICDHWYSSLPGPTWPNRFFLHGASSSGFDDSPSTAQMIKWETLDGFTYPNGSIFDRLNEHSIPYRLYNDSGPGFLSAYSDNPQKGSKAGAVPQVTSLKGITIGDVNSLEHFASDLQGPYPYPYTFIEPHYGNVVGGTYAGGSSQHPMDDVYGGEHMLAAVYSAIRNSPYWESSILLIMYDEHGGFFDFANPPTAIAPGDNAPSSNNKHGFDFTTLGVRVPAMVVSPLIPSSKVDKTHYDHSSVPKLLEDLWSLPALTQRDAAASSPLDLVTLTAARKTPLALTSAVPRILANKAGLSDEDCEEMLSTPVDLHKSGATMYLLKKAHREGTPATDEEVEARADQVETRGDLEDYASEVLERVKAHNTH